MIYRARWILWVLLRYACAILVVPSASAHFNLNFNVRIVHTEHLTSECFVHLLFGHCIISPVRFR